jgi:hypothetical protein
VNELLAAFEEARAALDAVEAHPDKHPDNVRQVWRQMFDAVAEEIEEMRKEGQWG